MRTMPAVILLSAALILPGCATTEERRPDTATPADQIKPLATSPLIYSHMTCAEISEEINSLTEHETELSMQQTRRVFRSSIHRRFLKIGQGDGIEAKQLSAVRGKREAAIIALEKKCSFDAPEKKAGEAPGLQGASDAPPMQTTP